MVGERAHPAAARAVSPEDSPPDPNRAKNPPPYPHKEAPLQLNERLQTRLGSLVLYSLHCLLLYNYTVSRHGFVVFFSHQQRLPSTPHYIRSRRGTYNMSTTEETKGAHSNVEKIVDSVRVPISHIFR